MYPKTSNVGGGGGGGATLSFGGDGGGTCCLSVSFGGDDDTLASTVTSGCGKNAIVVQYRQTYRQYLDGSGGAYCLIEQTHAVELPTPYRTTKTMGPVMQEILHRYSYGSGLTQRTRIVKGDSTVHVIHEAGRLPSDRELVSSIQTDLSNGNGKELPIINTEASGAIELYPRIFNATSSIAQNYHSLVQTAVMKDEGGGARQLSVLVRRTMGVASLSLGEMEYMLMRRISTGSDNQGPWPLDDKDPMKEEHMRLMFGSVNESEKQRFVVASQHEHPMKLLYVDSTGVGKETKQTKRTKQINGGVSGVPDTVWSEIMVRQDMPSNGTFVVRLQNMVPSNSGEPMQVPSLSKILSPWKVAGCIETTLTMQQTREQSEAVRLTWRAEKEEKEMEKEMEERKKEGVVDCDSPLLLDSLDLRTFVFDVVM